MSEKRGARDKVELMWPFRAFLAEQEK